MNRGAIGIMAKGKEKYFFAISTDLTCILSWGREQMAIFGLPNNRASFGNWFGLLYAHDEKVITEKIFDDQTKHGSLNHRSGVRGQDHDGSYSCCK